MGLMIAIELASLEVHKNLRGRQSFAFVRFIALIMWWHNDYYFVWERDHEFDEVFIASPMNKIWQNSNRFPSEDKDLLVKEVD